MLLEKKLEQIEIETSLNLQNTSALCERNRFESNELGKDRKKGNYFMDPKQKITFFKDYKVCAIVPVPSPNVH